MALSITRRQVARGLVFLAAIGLSFFIIKGAILFSLLLMAKSIVSLMAYPAVINALSQIMFGLVQFQTPLAVLFSPLLALPLFQRLAPKPDAKVGVPNSSTLVAAPQPHADSVADSLPESKLSNASDSATYRTYVLEIQMIQDPSAELPDLPAPFGPLTAYYTTGSKIVDTQEEPSAGGRPHASL